MLSTVPRSYDDDQLAAAVTASRSWRGVMRTLNLSATSAAAIRSVRRHADRLSLDHSHFTGQRRWTDAALAEAVRTSRSWNQTAEALGLAGGSSTTTLKGHAARLGIDSDHFRAGAAASGVQSAPALDLARLPRAGSMLAAGWFTLCGYDVSWPLEPCPYDLLAHRNDQLLRVQVKTTRRRAGSTWIVSLSGGGRVPAPYDPDDITHFLVIDGDLNHYLIPVEVVGGRGAVHLSAYPQFRVQARPVSAPAPSSGPP